MKKGFVLGKFMPLHKGHLALINFARQHCDFLYIIICFTKNEPIEGIIRKQWLYEELGADQHIGFLLFPYNDNILPNTSESSREVSAQWSKELKKIVPDASVTFTSEPYGDYLAEYMGIEHILFDQKRARFPISASHIRKEPFRYWDFIAGSAKPWYTKKIAVLGSESTGKSILTEKLAKEFNTVFVPEMARDIIEQTKECTFHDLEEIAILHAATIGKSISRANKLLFLDTDITITKSYSRFLFKKTLAPDEWIQSANRCDLYFFLETDCPFVQDGTRLSEKERNRLSLSHKEELKKNNIDYISVTGDWEERLSFMVNIIQNRFFSYNA